MCCSKEESHGCKVKGKIIGARLQDDEIIGGEFVITSKEKIHEDEINNEEMEDLEFRQYLWKECLANYWETPWEIWNRAILNPK